MLKTQILFLFVVAGISCQAQFTGQVPAKVSHAEPVYFDLIRDLGARKGERELNVGMGMARQPSSTEYSYLIEYEFAPVNRLGLELEIPLLFKTSNIAEANERFKNGVEGVKAAMQYSFFVSEELQTTIAAGYIFEYRLAHTRYSHTPFLIIAKRWGKQFHSLLYAGPQYETNQTHATTTALINASVHYTLPGTKNFIGVEVNHELQHETRVIVARPQIKMAITTASAIGLALGIPASDSTKPLEFLVRWIYEPARKK